MQAITVSVSNASGGAKNSRSVRMDDFAPSNISIQCNVTGTVNYTIQSTMDDPNDPINPVAVASQTWINTSDTAAVNATTSLQTNYLFSPKYIRVRLNSGNGTVFATILQSSNGPI